MNLIYLDAVGNEETTWFSERKVSKMKSFGKYVLFGALVLLIASVLAVVGHSIGLFPAIEPHVLLSFALGSTVGKVIVDHWM